MAARGTGLRRSFQSEGGDGGARRDGVEEARRYGRYKLEDRVSDGVIN